VTDERAAAQQRDRLFELTNPSLMNTPRPGDIQPERLSGQEQPDPKLSDQVLQHGLEGLLSFGERLKG
jgi:hypothetical protein